MNIDLNKISKELKELTKNNYHSEVRLLIATLIDNKRLIEVVKATNVIIDFERYDIINEYTNLLYKRLYKMGVKKFGQGDWNKYIYSNI